jgi:hypothetical protein
MSRHIGRNNLTNKTQVFPVANNTWWNALFVCQGRSTFSDKGKEGKLNQHVAS